ncbi:MAG: pyrroline-5-carboxylate reductase, partial [Candidatus Omnitrophica bacterium]|nr:pyrroline-5-carboxylate reductase [Candidatus Omnitrophota bacterium]
MKIGFIGCGNMAQGLIKGLLLNGIASKNGIIVSDIDKLKKQRLGKLYGVKTARSNKEVISTSNIIILAVKPQDIKVLLADICCVVNKNKLLISILAGVTSGYIKENLPECRVIRAMPNAPALVNAGITAIGISSGAGKKDYETARHIFGCVGDVIKVKESMLNAVTAVSGSGPAYFFLFKDALIKAAVALGIDKKTAQKLVFKTAAGSAKLIAESGHDIC